MHPKETFYILMSILRRDIWVKSGNKPLRRNINHMKIEVVFLFVLQTNFKIPEESMTHKLPPDFFLGQFRPL